MIYLNIPQISTRKNKNYAIFKVKANLNKQNIQFYKCLQYEFLTDFFNTYKFYFAYRNVVVECGF